MYPPEVPGAAVEAGQDLKADAGVESVPFAASGFPSYLECVGEAGGDAACAGLAGATSIEGWMPWAVAE